MSLGRFRSGLMSSSWFPATFSLAKIDVLPPCWWIHPLFLSYLKHVNFLAAVLQALPWRYLEAIWAILLIIILNLDRCDLSVILLLYGDPLLVPMRLFPLSVNMEYSASICSRPVYSVLSSNHIRCSGICILSWEGERWAMSVFLNCAHWWRHLVVPKLTEVLWWAQVIGVTLNLGHTGLVNWQVAARFLYPLTLVGGGGCSNIRIESCPSNYQLFKFVIQ